MKPYLIRVPTHILRLNHDLEGGAESLTAARAATYQAVASLAIAERLERIAELLERGATVKLLEIGYPDTPATPAATDKIVP